MLIAEAWRECIIAPAALELEQYPEELEAGVPQQRELTVVVLEVSVLASQSSRRTL
jgi:hypothetical protein